jgi:hypothetical protein
MTGEVDGAPDGGVMGVLVCCDATGWGGAGGVWWLSR